VLRKKAATYEDLELARRERCVAHPLVAARREAGPRGPRPSTAEESYPLVVDGALTLASGTKLRGGELLAPTLAGWQRFLELAPASGLKFGELREAGAAFWARKFPRGLLGAGRGRDRGRRRRQRRTLDRRTPRTSLDPQQAEALQGLLDRDSKRAREDEHAAEVDRRVLDNLLLQRAAMTDALSMGGGGKAEFEQVGRRFTQTAERITIVRAVAAVLRGRGYQAVMGEGDAQMLNILGKGGRLLGAATQSGTFRHAPGLTGEALAQVERDVADAHRIVKAIILEEAQTRGPKVSEEMMLAVWQRARAQVKEPASKATNGERRSRGGPHGRAPPARARRRGVAVGRGGGARHGGGACPRSFARGREKAAIQNLAANMDHYGAAAAASPGPLTLEGSRASAYQDARSALKALALPPKKYAYFVRRADEAIEAGKAWAPVVARARRVAEKLGGPPSPPRSRRPANPSRRPPRGRPRWIPRSTASIARPAGAPRSCARAPTATCSPSIPRARTRTPPSPRWTCSTATSTRPAGSTSA
jgi:hypothetical protein